MAATDDEEKRLRSVALQNANAILLARQKAERELADEREWLRVTLASIGDGVISTDAAGRVTFLNRVAEGLTGWTQAEAVGRPLADVFHIVNEYTRRPVENPALCALHEGVIVALANHTILIARDGIERPIEDSAAPMRDAAGAPIGAVLVFRDASERKRAEARVRAAEERAEFVRRASGVGFWYCDLPFDVLRWDERVKAHFWLPPDAPVTIDTFYARLHPEDREPTRRAIERSIADRTGYEVHYRTVDPASGGVKWVRAIGRTFYADDGTPVRFDGVTLDVTEPRRAEAALRASESRHRFLADLAATTQSLADPDAVMAATARLLAEHLGADRCAYADVEDESVFVITGDHPRGVPSIVGRWPVAAFGAECARLMRANEPYVVEDVDADARVTPDDRPAYRATTIQAVICVPLQKRGVFTAAMAVHQTVARRWTPEEVALVRTVVDRCWESLERGRVARTLRENEARFRRLFAAGIIGVIRWDLDRSLILDANDEFLRMTGYDRADLAAGRMNFRAMTPPEWTARNEAGIGELRGGGVGGSYEKEYFRKDGGRVPVIIVGVRFEDSASEGMSFVLDITERKRAEAALRAADRRKDEFLAVLAHELQNPLAPIRNGLQVLRRSEDRAVRERSQEMMDRQLGHMVRLIDDLLDVSRITRNKMDLRRERVRLADVVGSAVETAGPAIHDAGHHLEVSLPPDPVLLDADLTRLGQVFSNLLTNSAKYTPPGGRIWLTAEARGDGVTVAVRDNGLGIPADALPTIFDMFSQVDRSIERSTGGLGIGLALVKGLVEMHGGTVTAASDGTSRGSTFRVWLPVVARDAEPVTTDIIGGERRSRLGRRILVVDDNPDSASSMAMMLRLLGHEVDAAHDGVEAVETAGTFRPDVILMDVGMPRLNGYDATRRIRAESWGRTMTVIALTGWGQDADRAESKRAGCDGHLVKPVGLAELEALLSQLARGG